MPFRAAFKQFTAAAFSVLIFGQLCLADASQASLWSERRTAIQEIAALPMALPPIAAEAHASNPAQSALPAPLSSLVSALRPEFGDVREIRLPTGKMTGVVISIQDIHRNPEAQENIRRTALALASEGIQTIGLEGTEGPIDLRPIKTTISDSDRAAVSRFLLKENRISGPAAAALASASPINLIGIDDATLHAANVEAYRKSFTFQNRINESIRVARADIAERKSREFSAKLAEFDAAVSRHRNGEIPLGAYVATLAQQSGRTSPAIARFLDAFAIESSIDFQSVERDRRAILEQLSSHATKAELNRILSLTIELRTGRAKTAEFYGGLVNLCKSSGVSLDRYPAFATYVRYVSLSDGIRPEILLADAAALEKQSYASLTRTPEERRIVAEDRWLSLAEKLSKFELTNDEWTEYAAAPKPPLAPSAETLEPFESFYSIASRRDDAIARHTLLALSSTSNARLTLVTGGFHSADVSRRLVDAGVAVVTIVPRVTRISDGSAYLSVFAREKTPLEKLFAGERLFLASHPFPDNVRLGEFPAAALGRAAIQRRAPASATDFIHRSAPDAGYSGASVTTEGDAADVSVVKNENSVDVRIGLTASGELSAIDEQVKPTDTYALGYRLFGQLQNWRTVTDVALAWIVEFPDLVAASFSRAAFEQFLNRHWGDLAEKRLALTRLTAAVRASLGVGAVSAAVAVVLLNGPAFEPRLMLSILTAATVGGVALLTAVTAGGHLGQNIFGEPLTTGNPAHDAPRYIPNARIFRAEGDGVVLPARLELSSLPVTEERRTRIGERIIDIVARRRTEGTREEGRSLVVPLDEPITVDGRTFDVVVLKRVTYRGQPPNLNVWIPSEEEAIRQPSIVLRTDHDNSVGMTTLWRRATGTGRIGDSIAEYREMRRAGRLTPYSIGIGEFPSLIGENSQMMGFIAYLDNDAARARGGAASRAALVRLRHTTALSMEADISNALAVVSENAAGAARALHQLHEDAGMVHQAPHPDQFGEPVNGQSRIYDMDDAVWIGRLTRDEYIFLRMNDFLQLYFSFHLIANRANQFGPANVYYDQFLPMIGASNPLRELTENYFSPDEILAIGLPRIWEIFRPRASREMPYSRFWNNFSEEHRTPFSSLDRNIWTIADQIGGATFDRFLDQRVLAPLVRQGIPADTLRPYLRSLHEFALRNGRITARDVSRITRGTKLRRGWAQAIAHSVAAFAELTPPAEKSPLLLLPLTKWLVAFAYRVANPFATYLARGTTLPAGRGWVRGLSAVYGMIYGKIHSIVSIWGRSVSAAQQQAVDSAWAVWLRTPNAGREHLEARRRLSESVRSLPATTAGTQFRVEVIHDLIQLFQDSEPYEIAEFANIAHAIIPLIPHDTAGECGRFELIRLALPLVNNGEVWVRNRTLELIGELIGDAPSEATARLVFPAVAEALVDPDHGTAIRAAHLLERLLPFAPSSTFATDILKNFRPGIAQRRMIPDPSGQSRRLFSVLLDIAERGTYRGVHRAAWRAASQDVAAGLVKRFWFRTLAVPAIELPGLPGLSFALYPLIALFLPSLAPFLAPVIAGAAFAVLHGIPGRHQTWTAFFARFAASSIIGGAAFGTYVGLSGWAGVAAAAMIAYTLHGLWNALAPRRWQLTIGGNDEAAAADIVLDAMEILNDHRLEPSEYASRLEQLAAPSSSNLDISSVEGRLSVLSNAGLLDGERLGAELRSRAAARGLRFTMPSARGALQAFALEGASSSDIDDALRDSTVGDHPADVAVLPAGISTDAERRLMGVLSGRQFERNGRGESIVVAASAEQASRLRALGLSGVHVITGENIFATAQGRPTIDLARVASLLGENAIDLNSFSNVNLIAPAGHTVLVDGISPDLPWVRQAAILLIDDLLQAVTISLPTLNQLERAARAVSTQA